MSKPDRVFDRDREWNGLVSFASNPVRGALLGVVSGRRRQGKSFLLEALTLAVVASVRHEDTDYDSLLMSGVSRAEARDLIRPAVDRRLASWS